MRLGHFKVIEIMHLDRDIEQDLCEAQGGEGDAPQLLTGGLARTTLATQGLATI
jgi:hypothetical protein